MDTTTIETEVGALPMRSSRINKLVIKSILKTQPKDMDDTNQAKAIASWLLRYVPGSLYNLILEEMKRR